MINQAMYKDIAERNARAAQYLAEKRYERAQNGDLFVLGICVLFVAIMPLIVVYLG
jgi:hypothetical protein